MLHHVSIRTANIYRAIAFYELLGFVVKEKFTTGSTLACWLEGWDGRIELMEIPEPKPVPDIFDDENYVGYYHLSFDVSKVTDNLPNWLAELQTKFTKATQENSDLVAPLKILLEPRQQQICDRIYEVTFIADSDGLPLEFLRVYS